MRSGSCAADGRGGASEQPVDWRSAAARATAERMLETAEGLTDDAHGAREHDGGVLLLPRPDLDRDPAAIGLLVEAVLVQAPQELRDLVDAHQAAFGPEGRSEE